MHNNLGTDAVLEMGFGLALKGPYHMYLYQLVPSTDFSLGDAGVQNQVRKQAADAAQLQYFHTVLW